MESSPQLKTHYIIAKFLEAIVIGGVNCFALISGYVKSTSTIRLKSLFRLWAEVVFYSFFIGLILYFIFPQQVHVKDIIENLFPVSMLRYWYFSAYVILFFTMPLLNFTICHMPMQQARNSIMTIAIVICLFRCLPIVHKIGREFNDGFSSLWLMYLYLIGGFIRKYGLETLFYADIFSLCKKKYSAITNIMTNLISGRHAISIFFFCVTLSWAIHLLSLILNSYLIKKDFHYSILTLYVSPTILIASIMLLHYFSNLKMQKKAISIISFVAPMTFSIYLIQTQHEVWKLLFKNSFVWITKFPAVLLPPLVFLSAIIIYLASSLIDYFRIKLFGFLHL